MSQGQLGPLAQDHGVEWFARTILAFYATAAIGVRVHANPGR